MKKNMTKKIKVGLLGSSGKMGLVLRSVLKNDSACELFLEICSVPTHDFTLSFSSPFEIAQETLKQVDVWIDFSQPEGTLDLVECLQKIKTPLVSGTTGFSEAQFKKIEARGKKAAVFWASNMSLGLWALRQALKQLSSISHFDFVIDEVHHTQKKDNPSGTAKTLQIDLEKTIQKPLQQSIRGHRLGGIFGVHTITGASQSEMIKLEHMALNRSVFAEGAVKAALWIVKQKAGMYSMDELMNKGKK